MRQAGRRHVLFVAEVLTTQEPSAIRSPVEPGGAAYGSGCKTLGEGAKRREVMAKLQKIMQDEGVIIQPYWRSIYRHYKPSVVGAEMHPTFEIHVSKLGFSE